MRDQAAIVTSQRSMQCFLLTYYFARFVCFACFDFFVWAVASAFSTAGFLVVLFLRLNNGVNCN